jgi:hypothetical protein
MVGIGEPMTDYHYGNDKALEAGLEAHREDDGLAPAQRRRDDHAEDLTDRAAGQAVLGGANGARSKALGRRVRSVAGTQAGYSTLLP